mmetsp:Transcript_11646/g.36915  ORF Transcript_11646/g.36915 Transcript_11646/m.36915 type:complete len:354 (-) Transcript_11646:476-1537(-)
MTGGSPDAKALERYESMYKRKFPEEPDVEVEASAHTHKDILDLDLEAAAAAASGSMASYGIKLSEKGLNATKIVNANRLLVRRFRISFTRITQSIRARTDAEKGLNLAISSNNEALRLRRKMQLEDNGLPLSYLDIFAQMTEEEIAEYLRASHLAARIIQRAWRNLVERQWWRAPLSQRDPNKAATCIQRWWRGSRVRLAAKRAAEDARRNAAAIMIQKHVRGWLWRDRKFDRSKRGDAATCIQRFWRGFMGRRVAQQVRDLVDPTVEQLLNEVALWLIPYCYEMGVNISSGRGTTGRFMKPLWMGKGLGSQKVKAVKTVSLAAQRAQAIKKEEEERRRRVEAVLGVVVVLGG